MKKTKKMFLFSLLIILAVSFLFNLPDASAEIRRNNNFSCIRECSNQKMMGNKICMKDFNNNSKICLNQYRNCKINSRNNNTRINFTELKICQKNYSVCKKEALSIKNICKKNITQNYKNCKENCRNPGCTKNYNPVCGKLNITCSVEPCQEIQKTFINLCEMKKEGAVFLYEGKCKEQICSNNQDCREDEFCEFNVCSAEKGKCSIFQENCLAVYAPVCGCDKKTYSNDCVRKTFRISKAYDGECENQIL